MRVVEVQPLPGYRIRLRFEDGVVGFADLSRYKGLGAFGIWEGGGFERARVGSIGEVEWSEDVAICPDALYLEVTGKSIEELFPGLKETALGA